MNITVNSKASLIGINTAAGNNALLKFYDASDVLLAELVMNAPLGAITTDSTHHILTFSSASPDTSANATGVASYAKLFDSGLNWVATFDVTATGNGGAITINNVNMYIGDTVSMVSGVLKVAI